MSSKLEDFGLSDYDWTTPHRADSPSMYLYELVNWLTTVIDSLALKDTYKEEAYSGAVSYIASCFLVRTDFSSLASHRTRQTTTPSSEPFPSPGPLYCLRVNGIGNSFLFLRTLAGLPHGPRHPDDERERHREPPPGRGLPRRGAQAEQPLPRRRLR